MLLSQVMGKNVILATKWQIEQKYLFIKQLFNGFIGPFTSMVLLFGLSNIVKR